MYDQLSNEQLRDKARQYDRGINEGGDGYNPYTEELERRQRADRAAQPVSRSERRDRLVRDVLALDCSIARESGTYDADRIAAINAQIAALDAEDEAAFLAEWTADVTRQRRVEWNDRVRAGEFGRIGSGRIDHNALRRAQTTQGWTTDDLQRAVKLHGLGAAK